MADIKSYRERFDEITKSDEAELLLQEMLENNDFLQMSAPGFAEVFWGFDHSSFSYDALDTDSVKVRRFRIKN